MDANVQRLALGGGTLATAGIADVLAHLGPTGLLVGGLASYIAYRHGGEILEKLSPFLPEKKNEEDEQEQPQEKPKRGRSILDRALGRFPAEVEAAPPPQQAPAVKQNTSFEQELAAIQEPIVARDRRYALMIGPGFAPDINEIVAQGIFCCGAKGAGKTQLLARFSEQVALVSARLDSEHIGIPQVVFDTEGDLETLLEVYPNGVIADSTTWYSAQEIIDERLQVVVSLQSWLDTDEKANIIATLVYDLINYANSLPAEDRVPCPVWLDEAQYWLPQNAVDYLSNESRKALNSAFAILLSIGRKRGLTPMLFTQRIAQVQKSAISLGVQVFMRQILDIDQERAFEYISSEVLSDKKKLAALSDLSGVVCMPRGVQRIIKFEMRQSTHKSITPTVDRIVAKTHRLATLPPMEALLMKRRQEVQETEKLPVSPVPQMKTELEQALEAYRNGATSGRKLAAALDCGDSKGNLLMNKLRMKGLID